MKTLFAFCLLMMTEHIYGGPPSISQVRNMYQLAASQESQCKKLISDLGSYNENNNPLLGGYRACAIMIMAKYVFNPFDKLSKFNEGKKLLEKCIRKDSSKTELQYLRLTIQCNAPAFLGYKSSVQQDKTFLMASVANMKDVQLKKQVISFLLGSGLLSEAEKKKLNALK